MTLWLFLLFAFALAVDQGTKLGIASQLALGDSYSVIPGFFSLRHVVNTGAAWSVLANRSWGIHVLTALSTVAGLLLLYGLFHFRHRAERWPLLLLAAGCWGNWVDRMFRKGVIDFFSFQFGSYSFPVFNLADVLLVLGVALLAWQLLRHKEEDHA